MPSATAQQGDNNSRPLSAISIASSTTTGTPAMDDSKDEVQNCNSRPSSTANNNKMETPLDVAASKRRRRKRPQDDKTNVVRKQNLNLEVASVRQQSRSRSSSFASTTASESDSLVQLAQVSKTVLSIVHYYTFEEQLTHCLDRFKYSSSLT